MGTLVKDFLTRASIAVYRHTPPWKVLVEIKLQGHRGFRMSRSPLGGGFSNRSLSHPKGKNGETLLFMKPIGTASG